METIRSGFSSMRTAMVAGLLLSGVVALGSVALAVTKASQGRDSVYVISPDGSATQAGRSASLSQRPLEVEDHLVRFHELLFDLPPSTEAMSANFEKAYLMSDKSSFNYVNDLSEKGFYKRLVSANASQRFQMDSIRTDLGSYPYRAALFGKIYIIRESNITSYSLVTTCNLTNVGRFSGNPHGLLIERFEVVRNDMIETRKRY